MKNTVYISFSGRVFPFHANRNVTYHIDIRYLSVPCSGFRRLRPPKELYKTRVECSANGFMASFPGGIFLSPKLHKWHNVDYNEDKLFVLKYQLMSRYLIKPNSNYEILIILTNIRTVLPTHVLRIWQQTKAIFPS